MEPQEKKGKRPDSPLVYYGSVLCESVLKSNHKECTNHAYYKQDGKYLCGVHSNPKKRSELPRDKDLKRKKLELISKHNLSIETKAKENREGQKKGSVKCYGMKMMKEVPLVQGWRNVFPNIKHQNRVDGYGCASLSPMRLGPVFHSQPRDIPNTSLNIENYHQYNKVFQDEVSGEEGNLKVLPLFYERRNAAYQDGVPHRHKLCGSEGETYKGKIPLFSIHQTLEGEERRFNYVESRYFYCKAYEILAKQENDFVRLREMLEKGENLTICGYDARDIEGKDMDYEYANTRYPFGHELVLYCMLVITKEEDYPWNHYREINPVLYKDMPEIYLDIHRH